MREINRANKLERRDAQLRDKAESRRQAEEARVRDADQRKQLLFKPGDMIYKSGDAEVRFSFARLSLSLFVSVCASVALPACLRISVGGEVL